MEEWEIPDEVDDFESRYADELEMLEDFDKEGKLAARLNVLGLNVKYVR